MVAIYTWYIAITICTHRITAEQCKNKRALPHEKPSEGKLKQKKLEICDFVSVEMERQVFSGFLSCSSREFGFTFMPYQSVFAQKMGWKTAYMQNFQPHDAVEV